MERILWIAAGGAAGSVARYLVGRWLTGTSTSDFPWGTFAVNLAGSFLLGAVMHLAVEAKLLSDTARLALGVGVLGGFTTYSTFAYETWRMTDAREWGHAAFYVVATVVACLAGVAAGTAVARFLGAGPR
jgi:CrcB protein